MYYRKPLTYSFSSLEPYIDERTMREHYEVHFAKYTDALNEAIKENNLDTNIPIKDLLKKYYDIKKIRNNGGGYYNHTLYFDNISPNPTPITDDVRILIENNFGTYENFKEQFKKAGTEVFGSGWVWLIFQDNTLKIAKTANQDNPIMNSNFADCKILLGMDVWEHAYYLKHLADRKSYIDDFFEVVCWRTVGERLL
jgi:Fe-Mn family superoxide dismutase